MRWYDDRLNFTGRETFGENWKPHLDYLPMDVVDGPREILWTPDVYCTNTIADFWKDFAESGAYVYDKDYWLLNNVTVPFNVFWSRPGTIATKCSVDLKAF